MIVLPGLGAAAAVVALRRALDHGAGVFTLSGVDGLARLLAPLAATDGPSPPPVCFVLPREKQAEEAASDLVTLCGGADRVAFFPAPFRTAARGPSQEEQERNRSVLSLQDASPRAIVVSVESLLVPVAAPEILDAQRLRLRAGEELLAEMLLDHLARSGYRREDPVVEAGAFARRGGIVDVFGAGFDWPLRIEFFGDRIESMRAFDPATQRRREEVQEAEILPWGAPVGSSSVSIPDVLPGHVRVIVEPDQAALELKRAVADHVETIQGLDAEALAASPALALVSEDRVLEFLRGEPRVDVASVAVDATAVAHHLASRPAPRYRGDLSRLKADLARAGGRAVFFMGTEGRQQRLKEVLFEAGFAVSEDATAAVETGAPRVTVLRGHVSSGVEFPELGVTLFADGDVFPEEVHAHKRRHVVASFLSDFRDLKHGDFVVHEDHGVGRFERLETIEVLGTSAEFMVVAYQGGDLLRVPVDAFHRIQKHRGAEAQPPQIDRLGGTGWTKTKSRVRRAMRDMAAELLKLHAERKSRPGHAFAAESPWMNEFEQAFEYEETPDQKRAIEDVARDMAAPAPMDRLICGDVGYGKTEVAMRATMRAVADGKQVAVLSPTTVLAFQHLQTFRRRFAPFPVTVLMVSRLRSAAENADVLARARDGRVDIVIGTHRLLSKDASFKDLGLVIVDEEQRFGVAAKEKLKLAKASVDCLTLSATPIPRTLQMGLSGLRDMSVIETPPRDRIAIQTMVVKFSKDLIASAIRHELDRDGQVYVVHNRVESIYSLASMVRELVPDANVVVGHGAMSEAELERAMLAFVEGRANVLVATTIVENGLDVPRANTLIVHRADRFGLAQLYQLRGRVGRSDRAAFAYLMVPPGRVLSEVATKRLAAIREFSDLGSGFRLAALDLEMRGAGNLLGGEQSGHILAVGLDLYLKLLAETVRELQTGAVEGGGETRATLNLKIDLRLPADYVPEARDRIAIYKRAADARREEEIARLAGDLRDRFGPLRPEAEDLLDYARARIEAEDLGIVRIDRGAAKLELQFGPAPPLDPRRLPRLLSAWDGARFHETGATLSVPLARGAPIAEARSILSRLATAKSGSL